MEIVGFLNSQYYNRHLTQRLCNLLSLEKLKAYLKFCSKAVGNKLVPSDYSNIGNTLLKNTSILELLLTSDLPSLTELQWHSAHLNISPFIWHCILNHVCFQVCQ